VRVTATVMEWRRVGGALWGWGEADGGGERGLGRLQGVGVFE
jgi:hypothetical protein